MTRPQVRSRSRALFFVAIAGIAGGAAVSQASAAVVVADPQEGATVSGIVEVQVSMAPSDRVRETRIMAGRSQIVRSVAFQRPVGLSVFVDTRFLRNGRSTMSVVTQKRSGKTRIVRRKVTVANAVPLSATRTPDRPPAISNEAATYRFSLPGSMVAGSAAPIRLIGKLGNRADRVEIFLDGRLVARNFFRPGSFAGVTTLVSGTRLKAGAHTLRAAVRAQGTVKRFSKTFKISKSTLPAPGAGTRPGTPRPGAAPKATTPPAAVTPSPATLPPSAPLPGTLAFTGDWETGNFTQWRNKKGYPDGVIQVAAPDRLRLVTSPVAQGRYAARFEVRQGDIAAEGNRAEIWHGSNEREGDERWYQWHTMFDPSYPKSNDWQIFTQWHAAQGGTQPMVRFTTRGDSMTFSTVESSSPGGATNEVVHFTTPMNRGTWHTFRLHVKWSKSRSIGFVELYYNNKLVVPRTSRATTIPGIDVNYVKQGLYRSKKVQGTSVVYHDGFQMSVVG